MLTKADWTVGSERKLNGELQIDLHVVLATGYASTCVEPVHEPDIVVVNVHEHFSSNGIAAIAENPYDIALL